MSNAKVSPFISSSYLSHRFGRLSALALCAGALCACSPAEQEAENGAGNSAENTAPPSQQENNDPHALKYEYLPPAGKKRQTKQQEHQTVELPDDDSNPVLLSGVIQQWSYEGDFGCFGAMITDERTIQLWADIELCDDIDYQPQQHATIEVVYRDEDQHTQETLSPLWVFFKSCQGTPAQIDGHTNMAINNIL